MGGFSFFHDVAAFIRAAFATANAAFTAGGSGNNDAVTGVIIDRAAYDMPLSAAICIRWKATLAANKTLSLSWVLEHGTESNLGDTTNYATGGPIVVATGPSGGATLEGVLQIPIDLAGAEGVHPRGLHPGPEQYRDGHGRSVGADRLRRPVGDPGLSQVACHEGGPEPASNAAGPRFWRTAKSE